MRGVLLIVVVVGSVLFLTYIRQDYEKFAQPDKAVYRDFCGVLDDLYAGAKDARRRFRGFLQHRSSVYSPATPAGRPAPRATPSAP